MRERQPELTNLASMGAGNMEHGIAMQRMRLRVKAERWRPWWQVAIRQVLSWLFCWAAVGVCTFNSLVLALQF